MSSFLNRHLSEAALLGAFLSVLGVAILRRDLANDHAAGAFAAQRAHPALTDSARAATTDSIGRAH